MRLAWRRIAVPVVALLALAGCGGAGRDRGPSLQPVGLYTSLPILWRETSEFSGFLDSDAPRHWSLDILDAHGLVRPLDDLAGSGGGLPLPRRALLVMAQPRALSPDENVALDDWVRSGGRLLLFADPMLTSDSRFALGDNRRPQDVVLLSPILSRWGLELRFDEDQPVGEREETVLGQPISVNLAGTFALTGATPGCAILGNGLAARCPIGKGEVLALADAALLEEAPPEALPARQAGLEWLIDSLDSGERTGLDRDS